MHKKSLNKNKINSYDFDIQENHIDVNNVNKTDIPVQCPNSKLLSEQDILTRNEFFSENLILKNEKNLKQPKEKVIRKEDNNGKLNQEYFLNLISKINFRYQPSPTIKVVQVKVFKQQKDQVQGQLKETQQCYNQTLEKLIYFKRDDFKKYFQLVQQLQKLDISFNILAIQDNDYARIFTIDINFMKEIGYKIRIILQKYKQDKQK